MKKLVNKCLVLLSFVLLLMTSSCSTTKNIPENKYLLNSIKITHDTHAATADLEEFVRQQPNSKLRLMIYNAAGSDTTKLLTRLVRKMGQAPVIYDPKQTKKSAEQLKQEAVNMGYLNATVDTIQKAKGVKMDVIYNIKGGTPYTIRNYKYEISDTTMARIMNFAVEKVFQEPEILPGDYFDAEFALEAERERVSNVMRNAGYADFSKEYVYFRADTTLGTHEVDLALDIYPARDSAAFKRYKINDVTVISGFNVAELPNQSSSGRGRRFFRQADTTEYKGLKIIRGRDNFLRNSTVRRNNYLYKGRYFSDFMLTRTYEAYSKIGAISQVSITTKPSPKDSLRLMDALIILTPANAHWFRASLDGTNSAGDIGVAPSVSYQHQNLFNGGERLAVKLKGAYEFIASDESSDVFNQNFYEYGADVSVTFPLFVIPWLKKKWRELPSASTEFSVGINNQRRPEYARQFFNFTARYSWATNYNRWWHGLDLLDINYVRMPWTSQKFKEDYLDDDANPLLRESYKDQLIARTAYNATITRGKRFNLQNATTTLRFGFEISGVLPRLATMLGGGKRSGSDNSRKILGVSYAEYIKGHIDYAQTFKFSNVHSLAYHIGIGVAHPYGNSTILPFERRFFAGGANNVRGWNTRALGPGSFKTVKGEKNFVNQAGDLSLIMSIEDRHKLNDFFEVAGFIDAGNIWTMKHYDGQSGGQFKFNEFYREIALAYGAGLRFDLGFLLLRLDVGVRLYDPGRDKGDRFVAPTFRRMAWHFGIGYPF